MLGEINSLKYPAENLNFFFRFSMELQVSEDAEPDFFRVRRVRQGIL